MGKGCKEFKILKFRTMYESEYSHNGAKITARDDLRITPIGKWLRDTKVNELPQLWNVLVGEMSLVGPRPEDPDIVITWPENYRDILLAVRPGVTSPATITYRDEETLLSADNYMQDYLKRSCLPRCGSTNCTYAIGMSLPIWMSSSGPQSRYSPIYATKMFPNSIYSGDLFHGYFADIYPGLLSTW